MNAVPPENDAPGFGVGIDRAIRSADRAASAVEGWTDFAMASASLPLASGTSDDFGFAACSQVDLPSGTDLGGITIGRVLGSGGMGRVYEARQHAPERSVAVKVMRDGIASAAHLRRFEYESRILARLEHPGIARIYLAGTARVGSATIPYIVMELVAEATSLTTFCHEQGLGIRDRVSLMRQVCAAIAHGHRKGVIHRDLKPGNILVDSTGTPKVIDFGVARSIAGETSPDTALTAFGQVVGTLQYMSPEQLAGRGDDLDARTDVHALGLVLHELLVGALPYDVRGRTPLEAARIIEAAEPRILPAMMHAFGRDRSLARDDVRSLGAVVARCLEKRPDDRYASAADVEAELSRWLEGESVLARPPSLGRAVARLARRHRLAAVSTVGVLAAMLAALAVIGFLAFRADTAASQARAQLFRTTLLLAAEARDRDAVDEAHRLIGRAKGLDAAAHGRTPLEMACLEASLDESVAVLPEHRATVRAVAWSPDGRRVAAAAAGGTVRLWPRDAAMAMHPQPGIVLEGHDAEVWAIAWSPDGSRVATASADGTARIWDATTGAELLRLAGHRGVVYAVAFAAGGEHLATGGRDGTARVWDARSGAERRTLGGLEGTVYSVCFSPDGGTLATAAQDGLVRLWDASTGEPRGTLQGHTDRVFFIGFSWDGSRAVTASEDRTVRVWNVAGRNELVALAHPFKANAAAMLADTNRVVTVCDDAVVRWWDGETGAEVARRRGHRQAVWSIAASADGRWLATGSADETVRIWAADFSCDPAVTCGGRAFAAACAADGKSIAMGTSDGIEVWSVPDLRRVVRIDSGGPQVNDVRFLDGGKRLLAACDEGWVVRGDVPCDEGDAARDPNRLRLHARRVFSVDVDPAGRLLATAGEEGTARLWDIPSLAADAAPRITLRHDRRVLCVRFAADGRHLFTACEDRLARAWSVATGAEVVRFVGHEKPVNWLAISPDGAILATASSDATVRLWQAATGRPLATLRGSGRQVRKVAFTADGSRVVAVGDDGAAHVWDVAAGEPVGVLRGHGDQAWGVATAADGNWLVTAGWDGTARIWGLPAAAVFRGRYFAANTWPSVSWSTPALRLSPCISLGQSSSSTIFSAPWRPTTVGTEIATSRRP
jgi:WD40 repeat protein/tRNA A-37 threonylcarbamoyl transferase component Bud32